VGIYFRKIPVQAMFFDGKNVGDVLDWADTFPHPEYTLSVHLNGVQIAHDEPGESGVVLPNHWIVIEDELVRYMCDDYFKSAFGDQSDGHNNQI
jgi:hypothetical protein